MFKMSFSKAHFLCFATLVLFFVVSMRTQELTYRFGTRTVLDQYGSLQVTRGIVRTQLILDNNTYVWNTTDYVDGQCTEVSFHVIRPSSNGAFVWNGVVSTPDSFQSTVNATMHQNGNSGFYGSGESFPLRSRCYTYLLTTFHLSLSHPSTGTFTTQSGFVVPYVFRFRLPSLSLSFSLFTSSSYHSSFSFIWLQGLSDYQALTFTNISTGMISGMTLEDTCVSSLFLFLVLLFILTSLPSEWRPITILGSLSLRALERVISSTSFLCNPGWSCKAFSLRLSLLPLPTIPYNKKET
jgi:hypothetical protein